MKFIEQFSIPFKGLEDGIHEYDYLLDEAFFEYFDCKNFDFEKGKINAKIRLDKNGKIFTLVTDLKGYLLVQCDRCLDDFQMKINIENVIYVKEGSNEEEDMDNDEMWLLSSEEFEINIAQHLYELLTLNLPIKRVHEKLKDCNQEMLKKIKEREVKNEEKGNDPRWDKLKNLNIE